MPARTNPASPPRFRPIDLATDRELVFRLTVEYMTWVVQGNEALAAATEDRPKGTVEDYVARTLDSMYGRRPPDGTFYLVEVDGEPAGLCGLRQITPGVAEFKRIYVRPSHRGLGLGEAMLQRLIADAKSFGCRKAVLDSAPFMHAAHCLYTAAGFVDCPPYPGSEAPKHLLAVWRFMERGL
jgi:GNAT superfamily N-acetyltransferase